jgi:hypothetical protein
MTKKKVLKARLPIELALALRKSTGVGVHKDKKKYNRKKDKKIKEYEL